ETVELRNIVEIRRRGGKQVRLRIRDHLHAMLDRAQQPVSACERVGGVRLEPSRVTQRLDRIQRRSRPDRRVAAAMDHLLNLDKELDFANAAAPALEIEPGAYLGPLSEMVADSGGNLPHVFDHPEV